MKYAVYYWYRDIRNREQSGIYYTSDLKDVFAFCDMVKRHGGSCHCRI